MKNIVLAVLPIVALVVGFLLFYQNRPLEQVTPSADQTSQQPSNSQKWETKTDDQASVTVVVTPLDLSAQSAEWKFDVGMNTHLVELDQDMTKVAVLVDSQGNESAPLSWEGAGPGGHHREGVLVFKAIQPMPQSVELKIKGIGEIPERSFTWALK